MGAVNGFVASYAQKAGWFAVTCFTIGGILLGIGLGFVCGKMAYAILMSKRLSDTARACFYFLAPLTGLLAAVFIPTLVVDFIYR
jgi:hypothetical protein